MADFALTPHTRTPKFTDVSLCLFLFTVIFPILGPLFNFLGINIFPNASVEFFKKVVQDSSNDRNRIHQGQGKGANRVRLKKTQI